MRLNLIRRTQMSCCLKYLVRNVTGAVVARRLERDIAQRDVAGWGCDDIGQRLPVGRIEAVGGFDQICGSGLAGKVGGKLAVGKCRRTGQDRCEGDWRIRHLDDG